MWAGRVAVIRIAVSAANPTTSGGACPLAIAHHVRAAAAACDA